MKTIARIKRIHILSGKCGLGICTRITRMFVTVRYCLTTFKTHTHTGRYNNILRVFCFFFFFVRSKAISCFDDVARRFCRRNSTTGVPFPCNPTQNRRHSHEVYPRPDYDQSLKEKTIYSWRDPEIYFYTKKKKKC